MIVGCIKASSSLLLWVLWNNSHFCLSSLNIANITLHQSVAADPFLNHFNEKVFLAQMSRETKRERKVL